MLLDIAMPGAGRLRDLPILTGGAGGAILRAMAEASPVLGESALEERLRLAREAFSRYYPICFWSWPRETQITPELLPNVAHALRNNGGRAQFVLSERICPSTLYKARYSARYEPDDTPTAT